MGSEESRDYGSVWKVEFGLFEFRGWINYNKVPLLTRLDSKYDRVVERNYTSVYYRIFLKI